MELTGPMAEDVRFTETLLDIPSETHISDISLDSQTWGDLSHDLLELIRAFLPLSAVFRLRCVCKRWNSLCSDPGFNKLYGEVAPPTSPSVFILTHDAHKRRVGAYFIEFGKLFQLPFDFLPEEASVPLAEAGGLLCVGCLERDNSTLWVCNPLTRSWRKLPDCQLRELYRAGDTPLVNMMVKAKGDYKVVVIGDPSFDRNFSTVLKVYHSGKGLWTRHVHKLAIRSNLPSTSVIRDGVLYWCTMGPDGLHAYNLEKGVWSHSRISFPRLFTPFGCAYLFLDGDRLGLMGLKLGGQSFAVGLWTLQNMGGQGSSAAQWVALPYTSMAALERQSVANGFVQKSAVCLTTSDPQMIFQGNFMKGTWFPGVSFPDQDLQVQHIWCPFEARLNIFA